MTYSSTLRTCTTCHLTKTAADFYRHSAGSDRLRGECKVCTRAAAMVHYYQNRDDILPKKRAYAKATRHLKRIRDRSWRRRNAERIRVTSAAWRARNREHVNASARERYHKRRQAMRKRDRDPPDTAERPSAARERTRVRGL